MTPEQIKSQFKQHKKTLEDFTDFEDKYIQEEIERAEKHALQWLKESSTEASWYMDHFRGIVELSVYLHSRNKV